MPRCLLLCLALVLAPVGASAETVAAEWHFGSFGSTYGSFGGASGVTARGQEFVADAGGRILSAALHVGRSSDHAVDFRLSILAADANGLPTGDPLASQDFPAAEITADGLGAALTFTFTTPTADLVVGSHYVLVAEAAAAGEEPSLYFLNGASGTDANYAQGVSLFRLGQAWSATTQTDWAFRVVVDESTPVEATSWGALKARLAAR